MDLEFFFFAFLMMPIGLLIISPVLAIFLLIFRIGKAIIIAVHIVVHGDGCIKWHTCECTGQFKTTAGVTCTCPVHSKITSSVPYSCRYERVCACHGH